MSRARRILAATRELPPGARAAWLFTALLILVGTGAMLRSPPGIFSDSVSGFYVLQSMERGAPFNHMLSVNENDIALDESRFTSWWSPGQYLVPMPLRLVGLDLGQCMIATTIVVWLLGLAGFFKLFRYLGLSATPAAAAVAAVAAQPDVLDWARFYHGGELLQWGYFPWFALLALRSRQLRGWAPVWLALAGLVGLVLKLSFVILLMAVFAAILVLEVGTLWREGRRAVARWIGKAAAILLVAGGGVWAYVSAGESLIDWTSNAASPGWTRPLLFALSGSLNSLFSIGGSYLSDSEAIGWRHGDVLLQLSIVTAITAGLLWLLARLPLRRELRVLTASVYAVAVVSFVSLHASGAAVSFQVRHFRIAGLLLLAVAIVGIEQVGPRILRWLLRGAVATTCVAMLAVFVWKSANPRSERAVGVEGFSHIYAGRQALDALRELDEQLATGNNLIGVPWPQLGLEVRHNRVFNMETALRSPGYFANKAYRGRVDNLILVLPSAIARNPRSVFAAFKDHAEWRVVSSDVGGYWFFHSGPTPREPDTGRY